MTKLWVVDVQTTLIVRTEEDAGEKEATEEAEKAVANLDGWEMDLSEPRPMEQLPPGWNIGCLPWGGPGGLVRTIGALLRWNKEDEDAKKAREGEFQGEEDKKKAQKPGWNEVLVKLRFRDSVLTPGGESCDEPETVQDLVEEIDRQMNASHFGGALELELVE